MSASSKICIESYLIFALLTLQQPEVNNSELYLTQAQTDSGWMSVDRVLLNEPVIVFESIVGFWPVQLRPKKDNSATYPLWDELPSSSCFMERRFLGWFSIQGFMELLLFYM